MLAIAGGKGGCGKTTTTACLARALANGGADPIAVDADVDMPDLHHVAGVRREAGLCALADGDPIASVAQSTLDLPGVRVVTARPAQSAVRDERRADCAGVAQSAASGPVRRVTAHEALATVESRDRPILVDTPAGASPAVAGPLRVADASLLVATPTRESLADAAKTAAMARRLDAPPAGLVLTRSEGRVDPRPLVDCDAVYHVPPVERPLSDERVRARYDEVASHLAKRNI